MPGFSFNFSGDDIEDDGVQDVHMATSVHTQDAAEQPQSNLVPVQSHTLEELLATLPSHMAYSTTLVTSPQGSRQTIIPRRALFDVKMQLMAMESDLDASRSTRHLESGLGASDIETHVYEGGFKSWEGALDLARLLFERGPRRDLDDVGRLDAVVEMGCGQALPSMVLFQHVVKMDGAGAGSNMSFTFADYNESVLKLVTLPNILLVWALERAREGFEGQGAKAPTIGDDGRVVHGDGDLEITEEIKGRFLQDMKHCGLELLFLSGPWSDALVERIPVQEDMAMLVLGAETIYSPASLAAFTDTLLALLRQARMGKGIVASKRVYFGVGGGVDEFKERASKAGAVAYEVENSGIEGCDKSLGTGVGRCLLEVQMC